MTSVVLHIPRLMHCDPCEDVVAEVLTALAGVHVVWADRDAQTARVEFDSAQIGVDQMRAALARAAFPTVELVGAPASGERA